MGSGAEECLMELGLETELTTKAYRRRQGRSAMSRCSGRVRTPHPLLMTREDRDPRIWLLQ